MAIWRAAAHAPGVVAGGALGVALDRFGGAAGGGENLVALDGDVGPRLLACSPSSPAQLLEPVRLHLGLQRLGFAAARSAFSSASRTASRRVSMKLRIVGQERLMM